VRAFTPPPSPQFCPHAAHAPQAVFLALAVREALYGGAAGGGKSDALLMAALQYVDVEGYSALILRKSYADLALPDAIMDRAKTWMSNQPSVVWNDQRKVFTFPAGSTLTFGYLKYHRDRYRYQGSAYQFIGFDECTQFREDEYLYLLSRLRKPSLGSGHPLAKVPLRIRAASNPGGIGHEWVRNRFVPQVDDLTGEVVVPSDDLGRRRIFIPAKLTDNPSLDQEEYRRNLMALDPVLREQLLEGNWGARPPGDMFDRNWFEVVYDPIAKAALIASVVRWVRYWDLASTEKRTGNDPDWTAGALMGVTSDDVVVIADCQRIQARPDDVEKLILQTAERDANVYGCRTIRIEQEPGSSGVFVASHFAKKLMGRDYLPVKTTGPKEERARPYATYAANGLVRVLGGPWNADFLSEHEGFPNDVAHDDQVDAASGAFAQLVSLYTPGSATVTPSSGSYSVNRHQLTYGGARGRVIRR
jgi:predicted phage terminase large subunit-like protein